MWTWAWCCTNSDGCVIWLSAERKVLICPACVYAVKWKKPCSLCKLLVTCHDVYPMQCAANVGTRKKDVTYFLVCQGTGKTTFCLRFLKRFFNLVMMSIGWGKDTCFNSWGAGVTQNHRSFLQNNEPIILDRIKIWYLLLEMSCWTPETRVAWLRGYVFDPKWSRWVTDLVNIWKNCCG